MLKVGTPVDNPGSETVLVTSDVITVPRRYVVRVTVTTEEPFWANLVRRWSNGAERDHLFIPIVGGILGPTDLYEEYFGSGEYVTVEVRAGFAVTGTVQAMVELL